MTLPPSPFKGLAYFGDSEHDWRFFFGRERESEVVAANLMASRLTVLYGPSGVGKSSLLRAGVARRLRSLVPAVGGGGRGRRGRDRRQLARRPDRWRSPRPPERRDRHSARRRARGARDRLRGELYLDPRPDGGVRPLPRPRRRPARRRARGRADADRGCRCTSFSASATTRSPTSTRSSGALPGLFGNVLRLDHLTRAAARSAIEGPLRAYAELGGPEVDGRGRARRGGARRGRRRADRATPHRAWARGRGQARAPRRGAVPPARARAALGGRARARLRRARAPSTLAELGGAERIVEEHLERALAGLDAGERDLVARAVQPPRDAVGDEDRARASTTSRATRARNQRGWSRCSRRWTRRGSSAGSPGGAGGPPRYEIFHDVLAPAVLAWRARHEAERALEQERAAARRRHRRVARRGDRRARRARGHDRPSPCGRSRSEPRRASRRSPRMRARSQQRHASWRRTRSCSSTAIPSSGLRWRRTRRDWRPRGDGGRTQAALRESRVRTVAQLRSPVSDLAALPDGRVAAVVADGGVRLVDGEHSRARSSCRRSAALGAGWPGSTY